MRKLRRPVEPDGFDLPPTMPEYRQWEQPNAESAFTLPHGWQYRSIGDNAAIMSERLKVEVPFVVPQSVWAMR